VHGSARQATRIQTRQLLTFFLLLFYQFSYISRAFSFQCSLAPPSGALLFQLTGHPSKRLAISTSTQSSKFVPFLISNLSRRQTPSVYSLVTIPKAARIAGPALLFSCGSFTPSAVKISSKLIFWGFAAPKCLKFLFHLMPS